MKQFVLLFLQKKLKRDICIACMCEHVYEEKSEIAENGNCHTNSSINPVSEVRKLMAKELLVMFIDQPVQLGQDSFLCHLT